MATERGGGVDVLRYAEAVRERGFGDAEFAPWVLRATM